MMTGHATITRPAKQQRAGMFALCAAAMLCGCAQPMNQPAPPGELLPGIDVLPGVGVLPGNDVLPGIDVLLRQAPGPLAGARVGLITNHTGISAVVTTDGEPASTIALLHKHPDIRLVALFSPEHSITGDAEGAVESGRDPTTGLPIHSLYGTTRRPTSEMLADVDVLVFDIQDIGTRYYTYVWTMAHALAAAAENGKRFVVLDRPNPIGGVQLHGNVLDTTFRTFVGRYPVPMRHGLTPGELARLINGEYRLGADLTVIPVAGWRRDQWFDQTRLPWVRPSPNMPDLESATHYPGTCLYEGTNLSVGRGTPAAFQQIGAPWLDHEALVQRLARYDLPGVRIDAVTFVPDNPPDNKYGGVVNRGIRFTATDRSSYDPVRASVAALIEIQALHADSLRFREAHFDRLAGTDSLRLGVLRGASLVDISRPWTAQIEAFRAMRQQYLLYP
ncbi:DUF1343 domain-containing protein [soil metagenome]